MDTPLASKDLCEELYALTKIGKKFETDYYYDKFGTVVRRDQIRHLAKTYLPKEYTPGYNIGMLLQLMPKETPDNIVCRACIELAKHNLFQIST